MALRPLRRAFVMLPLAALRRSSMSSRYTYVDYFITTTRTILREYHHAVPTRYYHCHSRHVTSAHAVIGVGL